MTRMVIKQFLMVCSLMAFISHVPQLQAASATNLELFQGKNILILGGTGYLGRALTTELMNYNPRNITILSRDEVKHFNIQQIFGTKSPVTSVLGDIRDYQTILQATRSVDIVFHVAALKRMDALESNVVEAIKTDVIGSINVFNACIANNVDKVLFISTDKACSPINTYGACKFLSEKIFTNYDASKTKTKFMATRFGNILDSTGSVIPIFINKIKNGDEIPLTDERMTRFIVTQKEAVALMFDALRYGVGGELFLRRLAAMKIVDLIEVLKQKFNAHNVMKIVGLRPGEKIHEVLINPSEWARTIVFKDYFVLRSSVADLYSKQTQEKPEYMVEGTQVSLDQMQDYSSDQAVVSQERLAQILIDYRIIEAWQTPQPQSCDEVPEF